MIAQNKTGGNVPSSSYMNYKIKQLKALDDHWYQPASQPKTTGYGVSGEELDAPSNISSSTWEKPKMQNPIASVVNILPENNNQGAPWKTQTTPTQWSNVQRSGQQKNQLPQPEFVQRILGEEPFPGFYDDQPQQEAVTPFTSLKQLSYTPSVTPQQIIDIGDEELFPGFHSEEELPLIYRNGQPVLLKETNNKNQTNDNHVVSKTSNLAKGMVPSLKFINPLQSNLTGIIKNINSSGKYLLRYPNHSRLLMIDQHLNKAGIPISSPHINMDVSASNSKIYQQIASRLNHQNIPTPVYEAFKNFDDVAAAAKNGGKALAVIGVALDAYELGSTIYMDLNDNDKKLGKKTLQTSVGLSGSWAGGLGGAKLGAMGGAAIGTAICPGLGTAIGGFLGGIVGGIAGATGGRALGEHIVDKTYKGE